MSVVVRATFAPQRRLTQCSMAVLHSRQMHSALSGFAYFWFSHRTGGGEANA